MESGDIYKKVMKSAAYKIYRIKIQVLTPSDAVDNI